MHHWERRDEPGDPGPLGAPGPPCISHWHPAPVGENEWQSSPTTPSSTGPAMVLNRRGVYESLLSLPSPLAPRSTDGVTVAHPVGHLGLSPLLTQNKLLSLPILLGTATVCSLHTKTWTHTVCGGSLTDARPPPLPRWATADVVRPQCILLFFMLIT